MERKDITEILKNGTEAESINIKKVINEIKNDSEEPVDNEISSNLQDIEDVEKWYNTVIKDMKEMNFVELMQLKAEINSQSQLLEEAKTTIENIKNLQKEMENAASEDDDIELEKKLLEANAEEDTGIDDIEKFAKEYEFTKEKLDSLINTIESELSKYDDVKDSTKFLTENILEVINKQIDRLNKEESPNFKKIKIYYNIMKEVFENRTSVDYILKEIPKYKNMVSRLKLSLKKDPKVLQSVQTNVCKTLGGTFNSNQLSNFENYIMELFEDNDATFYFQYILYLIYDKDKSDNKVFGNFKWVDVLIMNIIDIILEKYDLPGGKDEYDKALLTLKDEIVKIL